MSSFAQLFSRHGNKINDVVTLSQLSEDWRFENSNLSSQFLANGSNEVNDPNYSAWGTIAD